MACSRRRFSRARGLEAQFAKQGSKLVGKLRGRSRGGPQQGQAVAISANGNTAVIGGPSDAPGDSIGAVWIFVRNGGTWSQQGPKLIGYPLPSAGRSLCLASTPGCDAQTSDS